MRNVTGCHPGPVAPSTAGDVVFLELLVTLGPSAVAAHATTATETAINTSLSMIASPVN